MKLMDLPERADLIELRSLAHFGPTRKIRSAAKMEMTAYIDILQESLIAQRAGLTWDQWCRQNLGSPASTFNSARRRIRQGKYGKAIEEGWNFTRPNRTAADELAAQEAEREMANNLC